MDMSGKTAIVAGLGSFWPEHDGGVGFPRRKVLGVDEKKPDADLHSFDHIDWDHVDLVMTSPVFNPRTPFILEAQRRGIPVMSEVELACSCGWIAMPLGILRNGLASPVPMARPPLRK